MNQEEFLQQFQHHKSSIDNGKPSKRNSFNFNIQETNWETELEQVINNILYNNNIFLIKIRFRKI